MAQICSKCSRVNPDEASYCYYDGRELGSHGRNGGPRASANVFGNHFVFPSGRTCQTFNQLALACQEQWREAVDLLQQGYLESFLSGAGRSDLALAAREAARFPDHDRGLDQFLAKLPGDALSVPKVQVEPTEVNLGQLKVGEDRELELTLVNQGMRLLYGSITCEDCVWLALGEPPGAPQKLFQFRDELLIPVRVRGDRLRASNKPLEARLAVESNGGNPMVIVRAEVPVQPFPEGVLSGARSPRQLAEKAKSAPKDAAPLFESGVVARWYQENGWTYPVQGPPASGLGAVQQYFEALGLTPPPRVEISERVVTLRGNPGEPLRHTLEVKTQEKRPVYAHATTDQPWLEVSRARLAGRIATIGLTVPAVPPRDGEVLEAKVIVTANGNQHFVVRVLLEVGFSFNFTNAPPLPPEPETEPTAPVEPDAALVAAVEAEAVTNAAPQAATALPTDTALPPEPSEVLPAVSAPEPAARSPKPPWSPVPLFHAVPLALLGLFLLGVILYDVIRPGSDDTTIVRSEADQGDPEPRIGIQFMSESSRFGIVMLKEDDPNQKGRHKRLTSDERGKFNNTCIKVGESERIFGQGGTGTWRDPKGYVLRNTQLGTKPHWVSVWYYPLEQISVKQEVEIVRGEQTGLLDTCLVKYEIENYGQGIHKVGLRVMLDTYIGANDGVPFLVPGERDLLTTKRVFDEKNLPDSISALEKPDPKDPGTVAQMGLKLQGLEPIEKMYVCRWPGNPNIGWDIPVKDMVDPMEEPKGDSCVVLYWASKDMGPGAKRAMGFTYGLATVTSSDTSAGKLGLMAQGSTRPGGVFTVTAYLKSPQPGEKVKIELPEGLTLVGDQTAEQIVPALMPGANAQLSWRVQVGNRTGDYAIGVTAGASREEFKVKIRDKSIFD